MEVDALVLAIIVISVALTTFVCTILGKYVSDIYLTPVSRRRYGSSYYDRTRPRPFRYSRRRQHCRCHANRNGQDILGNESFVVNFNHGDGVQRTAINLNNGNSAAASKGDRKIVLDQNVGFSVTFDRLGIHTEKTNHHVDLDQQMQFRGPDDSTTPNGHIQLNLIPAPRNNQLQMLRRISNLENVGTFNPTGKPHDYEEIGRFRNTVRGSGDGQPKDHLEAYIKSPVDPKHAARIKPGSSGQGPFSPIVVKDINIDEEASENEKTYMKLGIDTNAEDGDRLTPIVSLLEDRDSSNENTRSFKEELIQRFEHIQTDHFQSESNVNIGTSQTITIGNLENPKKSSMDNLQIFQPKPNRTPKEAAKEIEEIEKFVHKKSPHVSINLSTHENMSIQGEDDEEPEKTYTINDSLKNTNAGLLQSFHEAFERSNTASNHNDDCIEDEVFRELSETDQTICHSFLDKKKSSSLTRNRCHCKTCSCNRMSFKLKHPALLKKYQSLSQDQCRRKSSEEEFDEKLKERNSFPNLDGSGLVYKKKEATSVERKSLTMTTIV